MNDQESKRKRDEYGKWIELLRKRKWNKEKWEREREWNQERERERKCVRERMCEREGENIEWWGDKDW